jgi:outer membrane protein OmpA-like peptidoglycan-associated protein
MAASQGEERLDLEQLRLAPTMLNIDDAGVRGTTGIEIAQLQLQGSATVGIDGAALPAGALVVEYDPLAMSWQRQGDGPVQLTRAAVETNELAATLATLKLPLESLELHPEQGTLSGQLMLAAGVRVDQITATLAAAQIELALLEIPGEVVASLQADGPSVTSGEGLRLEQLRAEVLPHGFLLGLEQLQLAAIAIHGEQVELSGLVAQALELKQEHRDYRVGTVQMNRAAFEPEPGLALGDIELVDVRGNFLRAASGEFEPFLVVQAVEETRADEALHWSVASYKVRDASLHFEDRNIQPEVEWTYRVPELKMGALATEQPNRPTPVSLELLPDAYSSLLVTGEVKPLAEPIEVELTGALTGYGLETLNPYVESAIRHIFLTGQLSNDFDLTIRDGKIEMDNELEIRGLDVEPRPGPKGESGPPLGLGIALLEDKQGVINLGLPVQGDMSNPDFRVVATLNEVIAKAIAGAAAVGLAPVGTVAAVGALLASSALQVSFPPVQFAAMQSTLDRGANEFLRQLAGKLAERPKLRIRLCGIATLADAPPPPPPKDDKDKDKDAEPAQPPPVDEAALLALAQRRADAVRTALLDAGVSAAQVRACRPQLQRAPEAQPRVDIGL